MQIITYCSTFYSGIYMRLIISAVVLSLIILVAGCAYTTKSTLPEHIKKIEVDVFGNTTYYNNIEGALTKEIIKAINLSPGLKVVNKNGDAVLSGDIYKITNVVLSYDSTDIPRKLSTTMFVKFSLFDREDGSFILRNKQATSSEDSTTTGRFDVAKGEVYADAQSKAIKELAKVIVRNMVDNW